MCNQLLATRYLVPSAWYKILGTESLVPSTWHQGFGIKYLAQSICYRVFGTNYWVPNTWYQVLGTKYLVPSACYHVIGIKCVYLTRSIHHSCIRRPIVNHQSALHPSSIHYPPRSTHQRFTHAAHHLRITHPPSIKALMIKFASCLGCKHPPTNFMTMIAQRWDNRKMCGDDNRNALETCSSRFEC